MYQQKLGWPDDTLMRFHMFSKIDGPLKAFDYIFFCNANTRFKQPITFDLLRVNGADPDVITVRHPFFHWVRNPDDYPYERNGRSSAFIQKGKGKYYVMGGFNGGKSTSYLKLIAHLKYNIDLDKKKGIVARWHDESHLNKYIYELQENVKFLDHNFGFPEGHDLPLGDNVLIEFSDKKNKGGHDFLRGKENSIPASISDSTNLVRKIKNKLRRMYSR